MAPSRRRGASGKTSATVARSAAILATEKRRREELEQQSACDRKGNKDNNNTSNSKNKHDTTSTAKGVHVGDDYDAYIDTNNSYHDSTENNYDNNYDMNRDETIAEVEKQRKKFSLFQPFASRGQPYCKVVPEDQQHCTKTYPNNIHQRSSKSGCKRKDDYYYSEEEDGNSDNDHDAGDEGCLHCHRKVKSMPRIRVIDDDENGDHDSDEGHGGVNIQVRCDDCRGYICNGCHWCHEFQANHEIRVCDRCDAFYCRRCDEMDQCDDCGEVVCGSCSTLLSCKFCGGGLCEECATACGRCGIVLCSRDAKFAVDCDTCRLSYCLVCLASGSKDPCVRCGHRPSKRMEQLVHLRLKSIYKAFKSSSGGSNAVGGSGNSGDGNNINNCNIANGAEGGGNIKSNTGHGNSTASNDGSHGGRPRRNKPTTLQDMVGDHDDEDDVDDVVDPEMSMMMGAAAGVLPHKFCHDLEQNYLAEQKKADAAAEALLAELEEEETAIAQKKSKKKKKKERKNASKQNQQSSQKNTDADGSKKLDADNTSKMKPSQSQHEMASADAGGNGEVDEDLSSEDVDSTGRAINGNDEGKNQSENLEDTKMDPVEKELVECVNNIDLEGIENILFRLKGVPGRAALRKNAKKALKRLKLELNPPPLTPAHPKMEVTRKTEKKPTGSTTRLSSAINKLSTIAADPKSLSKKSTAKSSGGHEKSSHNNSKSSHSKSSLHKNNASTRCEAVVEIVSRLVGWMIGKNGQRIRDLMEESGAKIWIDQEKFKGQETRNVYISGDRKSVDRAVSLVNNVITNAPPPQGSTNTAAAAAITSTASIALATERPEGAMKLSTTTVEVKSAWVKTSGKSAGNTILGTVPKPPALITSSAPVVGNVLKEHAQAQKSSENVTIKEPLGKRTNSENLVSDYANPAISAPLASKSSEVVTEIVTCEARFVPLLIGKRGWTIKQIQDDSGARVDIDQSVTPRQVRISGSKADVDKAVTMVRDVLSYPHAQPQSSIMEDGSLVHPGISTGIQQSETSIPISTPTKQSLLAASAVLEHNVTRNTIPRQDETSDRIHSPPPMVGDAKSAISASSSLSSTPEPSMASSSKGFIASRLQNGSLLHPPMEQYGMGINPSQISQSPFLHPVGGISDALGGGGLWQSTSLGTRPTGVSPPPPLYTESPGQIGMQGDGQMIIPRGHIAHPLIHQQLQQQNQHIPINTGMSQEQQQNRGYPTHQLHPLSQTFGHAGQVSHGMNLSVNGNGSPMERVSQLTNQNIGNNDPTPGVHSTLGGSAPYNMYRNEGVPSARVIATTPLRNLMHHNGGGGMSPVSSPVRESGYRQGSSGLWDASNPNYSSSDLPLQTSALQPRSSSEFTGVSMGFSTGQQHTNKDIAVSNSLGYATSDAMPSQHSLPNTNPIPIVPNTTTPFSSVSHVRRTDDSLMFDNLFGRTNSSAQTSHADATNSLLTGFNGLSLSTGGDGAKSSGLWGSSDFTESWNEKKGSDVYDSDSSAPNVSSLGNIFSDKRPNLSRPEESRFNWDSTYPNR